MSAERSDSNSPIEEIALILSFIGYPILLFIVVLLAGGRGMHERYALVAVLGIIAAAGYALACVPRRAVYIFASVIAITILAGDTKFWI